MTTVYEEAGRRIAAWRRLRGWTQERLAEEVGRNASYLARIESGKRKASIDTFEVIAGALGESLGALFAKTDDDDALPDGFLTAVQGLSEEDLRLLATLARRISDTSKRSPKRAKS